MYSQLSSEMQYWGIAMQYCNINALLDYCFFSIGMLYVFFDTFVMINAISR